MSERVYEKQGPTLQRADSEPMVAAWTCLTLQFILLLSGPHYTAYRKAVPLVAARWRVCRPTRHTLMSLSGTAFCRWLEDRNSRCDHSNARRVQSRRAVRSRPRVHPLTAV